MDVYVISEIGINHNGDLDLAKKMIFESQKCGANAAKFQKRNIDLVYSKKQLGEFRESPWGNTQREQKEGLEFNQNDYEKINDYCKKIKFDWFASAWEKESLKFLEQFKLKYNKIASAMIIDLDFLELVAKEKKHTFISTGMSNMTDIENAVNIFRKNNCSFELMHCISAYPFDDTKANLNLINVLKDKFKCNVGYSGHEKGGLAISYAATAFGISSLERHFTLDRTMYGSDQAASIEPKTFKELIGGIRKIEKAIQGDQDKKILEIEKEVAKKLRLHINVR
jgi:N-acetylneuraminate synthase